MNMHMIKAVHGLHIVPPWVVWVDQTHTFDNKNFINYFMEDLKSKAFNFLSEILANLIIKCLWTTFGI